MLTRCRIEVNRRGRLWKLGLTNNASTQYQEASRLPLSQATSFWMAGYTSMFGCSYMIPPQGGDRRGPTVTREESIREPRQ